MTFLLLDPCILCIAVLLHRLVIPNAEDNRHTDWAGTPLGISMFDNLCLCILPSADHTSPSYPHLPYCRLNSMNMIFLIPVDQSNTSGNFNFFSNSTPSCQSFACSKIPDILYSRFSLIVVVPSFTKGICTGFSSGFLYPSVVFNYICHLPEFRCSTPTLTKHLGCSTLLFWSIYFLLLALLLISRCTMFRLSCVFAFFQ